MDFSIICRMCLGTKHLTPIFKKGDLDNNSTTIFITTGIKVEINDGLPQQMCKTCTKFIKESLKFRKLCKDAEIQLQSIKYTQDYHKSKNVKIQKSSNKSKRSKDVYSNDTFINVKIEPGFENNDDVPLLQKRFKFAHLIVEKGKNVKTKTEFVEIDEFDVGNDIESVKSEDFVENENELDINFDGKADKYENKQEIDIELVKNGNVNQIRQEIHKQYTSEVRCSENEEKLSIEETNLEISASGPNDEPIYETEFLDLHFDSDADEDLSKHVKLNKHNKYKKEIPNYKTVVPHNNVEFSKCNPDVPNNIEFPEYDTGYLKNYMEVSNMRNTNFDTEIPLKIEYSCSDKKNKKEKNNSQEVISIKKLESKTNTSEDIDIRNLQLDSESIHFIILDMNRVKCRLCQKDLSKRSIYSHMAKSHPGADIRKVKCGLCDIMVLKTRLKRHKLVKHGIGCYKCVYCKTEYDSKETLQAHTVSCTAKKKRTQAASTKRKEVIVQCDICNKSMQKASLKLHKDIKHAGMGPVCEHCGRRFGNKFRLSEHLRAKHGYEKFKCSMCDFRSASTMALRNHERRHRGEKPYGCEQCGAKFHASHLLAQHKQSHRTEKNMKCDQCPAAFKANNTLHVHKMTCHNNNTYQCPMCPRTYSARHYAVKHLRSVHRHTGPVGSLLVGPKEPPVDEKTPT